MLCRSLRQKSRLSGGQVNYREEEKRILDSILGRDVYDNRIRPSGLNGTGNAVFSIHTHLDFLYFECIADAATIIVVNLYIRSFAKIDDVKMVNSIFLFRTRTLNSNTFLYSSTLQEYSVQITFRQTWNDDRLSYENRLTHGDMRGKKYFSTQWITYSKTYFSIRRPFKL